VLECFSVDSEADKRNICNYFMKNCRRAVKDCKRVFETYRAATIFCDSAVTEMHGWLNQVCLKKN